MEFNEETPDIILKAEKDCDDQPSGRSAKCTLCRDVVANQSAYKKNYVCYRSLSNSFSIKDAVYARISFAKDFLNSDEKQTERNNVHNALQMCVKGKEVEAVLNLLCLNNDYLAMIFMRIRRCLAMELWPLGEVEIIAVGSSASGLAVRDSDIDVYIDTAQFQLKKFCNLSSNIGNVAIISPSPSQNRIVLKHINNLLKRSRPFENVYALSGAKVPIIRCVHCVTGFSLDINISCRSTVANTHFVRELVRCDPRIRELLLLLKLWAKNMKILRKFNMTSYCLFNLVVFYLQQPQGHGSSDQQRAILKSILQLQQKCKPNYTEGVNYAFDLQSSDNRPRIPAGCTTIELLSGFFYFYKQFDFSKLIVSPFLGKAIAKNEFTLCKFEIYEDQLADITQFMNGVPAPTFPVNSSMCVQDSFALTNNVAHTIVPATLKYFKLCLDKAYSTTCPEGRIRTSSSMLEHILYETPEFNAIDSTMEGLMNSMHM